MLDLAEPGAGDAVGAGRPEVILHLAAVVSGGAEADFDKGYRVNLDGTRHLLEAIRRTHLADGYLPRLVFASSIAVYGAPLPGSPCAGLTAETSFDEIIRVHLEDELGH